MQWFLSLHPVLLAFLLSLLMYALTALGAGTVFFSKKINQNVLTLSTGFAAGIMIAASFFSLLLPALEYELSRPWIPVTVGFLFGGAFIVFSDLALSKTRRGRGNKSALLYLAVTLHNVPEGMAVGVAFAQCAGVTGALSAVFLAVGIAVQNFPEGMCVAFPLRAQGMTPAKSFFFSQASGAIEIPASILGAVAATFIAGLMPYALAFSAGAMIAVVCSELIPECFAGNKTLASAGVLLGFCLMMVLDVALG